MLQKTRGIVLHQFKYSDTSIIVHIYTEQYGRQSYIINGIRGKKSKAKINLLQPLSILNLEIYHKASRSLQRIKEFTPYTLLVSIPYQHAKRCIALFLAEILYKTLREEEANTTVFEFLVSAISLLDYDGAEVKPNIGNFHLYFLLHFSRYLGFYPTDNYSSARPYFDLMKGQFVSQTPELGFAMEGEISALFHELFLVSFKEALHSPSRLTNTTRSRLLDMLVQYYQLHINEIGELKSYEVLKSVFR